MIISHTVTWTPQSATRINVVFTFFDNVGGSTVVTKLLQATVDLEVMALSMYPIIEQQLADVEIAIAIGLAESEQNPDKVAQHQDQNDFDRRLLAQLMTISNVHTFYAGYAFFQAMEVRGGANKPQRAAYLEVPQEEYDLVDKRFNDVKGIEFFILDEKGRVWDSPLDGWE